MLCYYIWRDILAETRKIYSFSKCRLTCFRQSNTRSTPPRTRLQSLGRRRLLTPPCRGRVRSAPQRQKPEYTQQSRQNPHRRQNLTELLRQPTRDRYCSYCCGEPSLVVVVAAAAAVAVVATVCGCVLLRGAMDVRGCCDIYPVP